MQQILTDPEHAWILLYYVERFFFFYCLLYLVILMKSVSGLFLNLSQLLEFTA